MRQICIEFKKKVSIILYGSENWAILQTVKLLKLNSFTRMNSMIFLDMKKLTRVSHVLLRDSYSKSYSILSVFDYQNVRIGLILCG